MWVFETIPVGVRFLVDGFMFARNEPRVRQEHKFRWSELAHPVLAEL